MRNDWPCHRCPAEFQTLREINLHEKTCKGVAVYPALVEEKLLDLKERLAFLNKNSTPRWTLEMRKAADVRVKNWRSK